MNKFTETGFIIGATEFRYNCDFKGVADISIISEKENLNLRIFPSGLIRIWDINKGRKIK